MTKWKRDTLTNKAVISRQLRMAMRPLKVVSTIGPRTTFDWRFQAILGAGAWSSKNVSYGFKSRKAFLVFEDCKQMMGKWTIE